jgi:subtilisin family serine protease
MNRLIILGAAFTVILLSIPIAFAFSAQSGSNDNHGNRLIVHTTSLFDKIAFQLEGCQITHELTDAVSVNCPQNVQIQNSEPDKIIYVIDLGSDTQIRANEVWSSYTGNGVTVAILDTGIDWNNLQLKSSTGSVDPTNGRCFAVAANDCGNSFFDDFGHGTHVAGIIASTGLSDSYNGNFSKGVASNARIWMAKVCNGSGNCYTSDIVAAIQYVVNNHISKVMSISLGGGGTTRSNCDSDYLASQINWAYNNGVVSVVAAGNRGTNSVSSPACASDAIAVAAVDSYDNLAYFSSYGAALKDHGVASPGVNIYSTVPTGNCYLCSSTGYAYLSGTSMATPHVSATVALMLQKNPTLTADSIRAIIFANSNCLANKYGSCPNIYKGKGRIDAFSAVNAVPAAVSTSTTTTVPTTSTTTIPNTTSTTTPTSTTTSTSSSTISTSVSSTTTTITDD